MAEPAGARWMFPRSHRAIALRPEVGGSELVPSGVQTAHVPGGNVMAPISTPSHGRRFGMHARALLSVSKTIQTPPPVAGTLGDARFPQKRNRRATCQRRLACAGAPRTRPGHLLAPQHQRSDGALGEAH